MELYTDEYFMNEALKEANKAFEEGEIPVGAVVVCGKRIIARAYNQSEKLNDVTSHAEILAITAASVGLGSKYLNYCKLYVTQEPCVMCSGSSYRANLQEIHFGAEYPRRCTSNIQVSLIHHRTNVQQC